MLRTEQSAAIRWLFYLCGYEKPQPLYRVLHVANAIHKELNVSSFRKETTVFHGVAACCQDNTRLSGALELFQKNHQILKPPVNFIVFCVWSISALPLGLSVKWIAHFSESPRCNNNVLCIYQLPVARVLRYQIFALCTTVVGKWRQIC